MPLGHTVFSSVLMILFVMAFYTLFERKSLGIHHFRKGPNKVGLVGLPQPVSDALKLYVKEKNSPGLSNMVALFMAPMVGLALALITWVLYPFLNEPYFLPVGMLIFFFLSGLNAFVSLGVGWASNSKYGMLGAVRSVAQIISYEVSLIVLFGSFLLVSKSFNLSNSYSSLMVPVAALLFIVFVAWAISGLAELSRTPFDLLEGESELVSGFNVELSGGYFAFIFMAEYMNILFMSVLCSSLFFTFPFLPYFFPALWLKSLIVAYSIVWIRSSFPRLRYDQLMWLTWRLFLPIGLLALLFGVPLSCL